MADHKPCIHQPGVFNIEIFNGTRWRGGMNRRKLDDAIDMAKSWSSSSGYRSRVFSPEGELVFDTDTEAAAIEATSPKSSDMGNRPDRGLQALVRTAIRVHAWHTPAIRLSSIAGAAYWTGVVAGARDYANGIGAQLADAADARGDSPSPDELERILQCCRAGLSVDLDVLAVPKVLKRLAAQGVQISDELIAKLDIDAIEQLENSTVSRPGDFDNEHAAAVVDSNDRPFHEAPPASVPEVYWTSSKARAAAIARDAEIYPERPYSIDVVALLADPHYDEHGHAEMLAGAEALANLIEALQAMQGIKTKTGIIFSCEQVADLALATKRVLGVPA